MLTTVVILLFRAVLWTLVYLSAAGFWLAKHALGRQLFTAVTQDFMTTFMPWMMAMQEEVRQKLSMSQMTVDAEDARWLHHFTQTYHLQPQPDKAAVALEIVSKMNMTTQNELVVAGMVLALVDRHPDLAEGWEKEFPGLFREAKAALIRCEPDRPGWNDYYMARWLILADEESTNEIRRRTALDGPVGESARWMVQSMANLIPSFATVIGLDETFHESYPTSEALLISQLQILKGSVVESIEAGEMENGHSQVTISTATGIFQVDAKALGVSVIPKKEVKSA